MRRTASGFTLIELVITIVLLGILSGTVMNNFGTVTQHRAVVRADEFRRNLSHIQLLAISQGKRLRLSVDSGSYTVTDSTPTVIQDPATGLPFNVVLPLAEGVTFTASSTLDFDTLGRPVSGAGLITANPAGFFTLSGNHNCVDVSVLPITGFAATAAARSC